MTDKQKIQSLIDAAMRSAEEPAARLKRAVPVANSLQIQADAKPAAPEVEEVETVKAMIEPQSAMPAEPLDKEAAEELGRMLDERIDRDKRKRRIEAVASAALILGAAIGGTVWFMHDKERVSTLTKAVSDIRSVGDPKAMAASYDKALAKIGERGTQLDMATTNMGIDPAKDHGEDVYMEAEMQQMMGDNGGPTVGQRNKLLTQKFGDVEKNGLR